MNMVAVVGLLILLSVLWPSFRSGLPKRYRSRECEGAQWRRAFPHAPKDDIREFLMLFTSAFAFQDSGKLKFNPNDQVWEIYRDLYPHRWIADALELETFTDDLCAKYGVSLGEIWHDKLTLGEIFACVRRSRSELTAVGSTVRKGADADLTGPAGCRNCESFRINSEKNAHE